MTARSLRIVAWCAVALIGVLSLVPGEERPHTGMPGQIEHLVAYALTSGALALAYGPRLGWRSVPALSAYAAALEVAQLWIPGRTGQVVDWLAGSAGAVLGLGLAAALIGAAQVANRKR